MTKRKDESIETIRGIALILMVAAHVIGASPNEGMRVDNNSFWHYTYVLLSYVRMPLFTVISGYVYALRPLSREQGFFRFLQGKARRILLPLISISTIQYIFQCYTPGVNAQWEIQDIWRIYFYPYSHFWYLQAIYLVFIIIAIVDYFNLASTPLKWFIVLLFSSILFLTAYIGEFFSISRAFYLLPFFILGCGLKRYEETILSQRYLITGLFIILLSGILLQQLSYFKIIGIDIESRSLIGLLTSLSSTTLLIKFRFKNKLLYMIGFYSYGIFLLHLFGSASSRIFLELLNLNKSETIVFLISLSLGVLIPILMELFIMKYKTLKLFLLGLK